ncbi:helix-turn-helix transcriptional regulator [Nonomuraea sp. MG754425]|nr:helix-turn-helix transcriptional regulator [Nonomuraea sp. MG754425]
MPVPGLTPREAEVLAVLAEGASNAGIAAQLVVSERTVDAHLRAIFIKLDLKQEAGTNRRVQAARIWLDNAAANRRQGP